MESLTQVGVEPKVRVLIQRSSNDDDDTNGANENCDNWNSTTVCAGEKKKKKKEEEEGGMGELLCIPHILVHHLTIDACVTSSSSHHRLINWGNLVLLMIVFIWNFSQPQNKTQMEHKLSFFSTYLGFLIGAFRQKRLII